MGLQRVDPEGVLISNFRGGSKAEDFKRSRMIPKSLPVGRNFNSQSGPLTERKNASPGLANWMNALAYN